MATFIACTHLVNNKPAAIQINVDQICRIADSAGETAYPTTISLTNGQADVRETVAEVMQLIKLPNVAT